MARTSVVQRNLKRQRLVEKYEQKRARLKEEGLYEEFQKLPRNSSKTRVVSRCKLTGRPRAVYKKFGLCRNVFRDLALQGKIPGIKKASW